MALDFSEQALEIAQRLTQGRATLLKADLVHDNLKEKISKPFDIIFSDGLLEHFSRTAQKQILSNLVSCLSDHGVLITFVPNKFSPWELIRPFYMPGIEEAPFVLSDLIALHEDCRLSVAEKGGVNTFPFALSPDELLGQYVGMLLYVVTKKGK